MVMTETQSQEYIRTNLQQHKGMIPMIALDILGHAMDHTHDWEATQLLLEAVVKLVTEDRRRPQRVLRAREDFIEKTFQYSMR